MAEALPIDTGEGDIALEGTITALRAIAGSQGVHIVLNRRMTVVVPTGLSDFFAGMRVSVRGRWRRGIRRRYFLATSVEPVETPAEQDVERLCRTLVGLPDPMGEQRAVLAVLAPALSWLLTSGFRVLAAKLARLPLRKAEQIAGNPFLLVKRRELDFDSAEMLHRRLQGDPWLMTRLQAGTTEVLRRAERSGCARISSQDLANRVSSLLRLDPDIEVDWELVWRPTVVARDGERVCLKSWFHQRRRVLQLLKNNQMSLDGGAIGGFEHILGHRYSVVTGAAMSGKTSLLRDLAARCRAAGWRVALTAMTGKAANVIGPDAVTIHRLIGYGPKGCMTPPLDYDLVIIDEVSMMTWPLLASVMNVVKGHVVFCGDPRQLPPVEGEPVFSELLTVLPVHDLGSCPTVAVESVRHWSVSHLLSNLERLCRRCEVERREWQVLSPIKRSLLGTVQLNQFLQSIVNQNGLSVGHGYRVGDRVLVIRNDYRGGMPIYNGQSGTILGVGVTGFLVRLESGGEVDVAVRDLELAYCMTVHKSQGSRYDTVVFIIPPLAEEFATDAHMQYVGLTRGRHRTLCFGL